MTHTGPDTGMWLAAINPAAAPAPAPDVVDDQVADDVPRVERWKLTEPVRLYSYLLLLVITAGLQLAGVALGEWPEFTAVNGALLLGVGGAGEAIRASVYSPAGTVRAIRAAVSEVAR